MGLSWPYYDRVVKMSVVDQGPDKLTSMTQFSQYMTSDKYDVYDKPTAARNGAIGYSTYMKMSDIMETLEFVKNDAIIISVNIRNMQSVAAKNARVLTDDVDDAEEPDKHGGGGGGHHGGPGGSHGGPETTIPETTTKAAATTEAAASGGVDDEPQMMSIGAAIGLALACTFVALIIMMIVLV